LIGGPRKGGRHVEDEGDTRIVCLLDP